MDSADRPNQTDHNAAAAVTVGDCTKELDFTITSTAGTSDITQGQLADLTVLPLN